MVWITFAQYEASHFWFRNKIFLYTNHCSLIFSSKWKKEEDKTIGEHKQGLTYLNKKQRAIHFIYANKATPPEDFNHWQIFVFMQIGAKGTCRDGGSSDVNHIKNTSICKLFHCHAFLLGHKGSMVKADRALEPHGPWRSDKWGCFGVL